MARYRMYIDESGNHHVSEKSLAVESNRYLCLLGCILEQGTEDRALTHRMEAIKQRFFPNAEQPVVFHREDIMNVRKPFDTLQDEGLRAEFNAEMLDLYASSQYKLVAVVLDKVAHKRIYGDQMWHPYHYCLQVLMDRYVKFLVRRESVGDVLAEVRGKKEDRLLRLEWDRIRANGTKYTPSQQFAKRFTSKELHLKPKQANLCGLQLADLLVTQICRAILVENEHRPMFTDQFGRKLCKAVKCKFDGDQPSWSRIFLTKPDISALLQPKNE